jgi:hypothetical protein
MGIDPRVGKPQRAKMGVTDSRGAVPTKDERRTDRLSIIAVLPKSPGNSASVAAGTGPDASCEKLSGGASLLPGPGIPIQYSPQKNKAPNRAPDIKSLVSSCEIRRTTNFGCRRAPSSYL